MSYQPHLHKGGELYHFRTKGSKNGVSNTPGYRAIGKKAVGFLNSAGQYVYNNAAKAAGSAGNWLSDRGKQVSKAATNAYRSTREAVTGSNAKKTYQNKKTLADNTSYYNRNRGTVHMDQVRGQKRTQQEQAKIAKQQYDRSLFGRAENAGKAISKAAGSAKKAAGDWLSDRGRDVSKAASSAKKSAGRLASKVGSSAKKAGESVSKFASDSFDSAKKSASEGAKRAGEFISGLTKKKEKSKSNQKTTPHFELDKETGQTVYINENGEKVNKSGKNNNSTNTNNTSIKRSGNAKSYVDRIVSSSSKSSSKSKTNMSDKPKNVSDEYWEAYTSNGGTRESYDKEMKARSSSKNSSKASEYRSNAALARDTGEMHVDNDKKYRAKYNKKTTAQDIIDRNKKRAQFINKSKSYEKAADSIDGMGNKYEYKRVKTSSKAIPYSGYYAPKSENASKSSSKSSNSAKSDYERELEFNSRKNNEFGMGNASENPNFSYYTVDKETGKTVWVDKNGKKHYN